MLPHIVSENEVQEYQVSFLMSHSFQVEEPECELANNIVQVQVK